MAAVEVGFTTIMSSYAMGGLLLAFFFTSSALTRVSSSMKKRIDAEFKEGGQRDWKQVVCNGALPAAFALTHAFAANFTHLTFLGGCVPASLHVPCACAMCNSALLLLRSTPQDHIPHAYWRLCVMRRKRAC
jgi:uncharacterized membrane protein